MPQKLQIAQRLRRWIDDNYPSQADLARRLGKDRSFFTPYLNGESIMGGEILAELRKLDCDINWLLTGEKIKPGSSVHEKGITYISIDNALHDKIIYLPEFPVEAKIAAGNFEFKSHDYPEYIKLDLDPREHFCVVIDDEYGYSMTPFIEPGDLIFCSRNKKLIKDGDLVVIRFDETKGAIKKVIINPDLPGMIGLESFNKAERTILLKKSQIKETYKVVLIWKRGK